MKREWKKFIPSNCRKIIIARALNDGVREKGFQIIGYLITERMLVLILKNHQKDIDKLLHEFYELFLKELQKYLEAEDELKYNFLHQDENEALIGKHLFKKQRLFDETLERLLTGRQVNQDYYDPNVARLKDIIQQYEYCSALDYTCAISPVMVVRTERCEEIYNTVKKLNKL